MVFIFSTFSKNGALVVSRLEDTTQAALFTRPSNFPNEARAQFANAVIVASS